MAEQIFYNGCPGAGDHAYCVLKVHVNDGKITKVESADYPGNLAQRSICLKGLASPRLVYHPDRLKYPLKRIGKRGEGKWQRLSWDQAFDEIGERLLGIRSKYGPEALKVTPTGSSSVGLLGRFVGNRFANLWGSGGDFEGMGPVADGSPLAANMFYLGKSMHSHDPRDLVASKMIIMWGWNPAETRSPDMPFILDARDRGARVIVIGTYFDATAAKADQWVPVKEGCDAALAMGMINLIIEDKAYDQDYVVKYTVAPFLVREDNGLFLRKGTQNLVWNTQSGAAAACDGCSSPELEGSFIVNGIRCKPAFQLLKERAQEYTPEKASRICGTPPDTIRALAREYARTKPAAVRWSYGMARTYMSTLGCRAVLVLGALTGNIGVAGGGVTDTDYGRMPPIGRGDPARPTAIVLNARGIEMPPGAPGTKMLPGSTTPMKGWALIRQGKPYPVKALITSYQNKLHPTYGQFKSELAILDQMELFVTMDIMNTRTAQYADYSLPACTIFERDDLQIARNYILKMEKAIEPLYESKSDVDIWTGIAQRVGLGEHFRHTTDDYIKMAIDSNHPTVEGITFERLQKEKLIRGNVPAEPVIPFADKKFPTPSGRVEFYKERLLPFGEELPLFKGRLESPGSALAKKYPLTYLTIKNRTFTNSLMATVDWMREIDPEPVLDMNPVDAAKRGIEEGNLVAAFNDRGRIKLKARLTEAVPPGTVNCDHGWWPEQFAEGHYTDLTHGIDDLSIVNPSLDIEPIISDRGCAAHLIYWDCLCEVSNA
jgi:anaerobic selenocysteine-containing dehydrogenase